MSYQPVGGGGHPPSHWPIKPVPAPLDVVAVVSNPARYRSRYSLYRDFERRVVTAGARLTTVECAFGDRPHEVTTAGDPRQVQLRTDSEVWIKEAMLNVGVSRLPSDWEYVAWVDADITFARPDWVQETIQQLQHHPVVQMWSVCHDLGPDHHPFQEHRSFAYCYRTGVPFQQPGPAPDYYYHGYGDGPIFWHPGFAWAATRQAINDLGGLVDRAILGSADHHMASALIGRVLDTVHGGLTQNYRDMLLNWQDRAERHVRRNLGYVEGLILHAFHGKKKNRYYKERWKILVDRQYDPARDIKRDWQGLIALEPFGDARSNGLRDDIHDYFKSRNEDSIDND